jgi:hypothetical protein
MEGRAEWHNKIPDEEQMVTALEELGLKPLVEA